MKKIIRLTERDLTRIVKRVINESKKNDRVYKNHLEENILGNIISRYGKRALDNMGKEYRTWSFRLGDGDNKIAAKEFVDYHNDNGGPYIDYDDDDDDEVIITINPDIEETMWEDGGIKVGYYMMVRPNDLGVFKEWGPEKIPLKLEHYESMSPEDLGIKKR